MDLSNDFDSPIRRTNLLSRLDPNRKLRAKVSGPKDVSGSIISIHLRVTTIDNCFNYVIADRCAILSLSRITESLRYSTVITLRSTPLSMSVQLSGRARLHGLLSSLTNHVLVTLHVSECNYVLLHKALSSSQVFCSEL